MPYITSNVNRIYSIISDLKWNDSLENEYTWIFISFSEAQVHLEKYIEMGTDIKNMPGMIIVFVHRNVLEW